MTYIIGLTGGIGSGKSAATQYFSEKGILIVDADDIAHQVSRQSAVIDQVKQELGEDYITADYQLNRPKLRQRIFSDSTAKQWLEALLHPRIRAQMLSDLRAAKSPYAILSAPLLLENKLEGLVNRVLVVDVPEAVQRQRAAARDDTTLNDVDKIMQAQLSRAERLARADDTLDNSGSLAQLQEQIDQLHQRYLNAAAEASKRPR